MIHRILSLLFVSFCSIALTARAEDSAKVLESFQGAWEMASVVDNGTAIPTDAIRGARVVFTKDIMTLISPNGKEKTEYLIKLDPTRTPKAIDITPTEGTFKGKRGPGIYEIDQGVLRICQPHQPTTPRPTRFEAPEGSGLNLMVLKRMKN